MLFSFDPDWKNLISGHAIFETVEGLIEWVATPSSAPHPFGADGANPPETTLVPIGAIGWTQKTITPKVFNVTIGEYVPFEEVVRRVLAHEDLTERQTYLRNQFDPLIIYEDPERGYLSIDNRRLAIYRLTLPSSARMPVRVVTREQAGEIIANRINEGGSRQVTPEQAIRNRYQSRNDGYSINITFPADEGGRVTLSQGIDYVQSPYMILDTPDSIGEGNEGNHIVHDEL